MEIFSTRPGAVVAVDQPGIPMTLFLEDWGGYSAFKSIITNVAIQTQSGVQYMNTLRNMIYVYTFGERPTPFIISGLSFASQCERFVDQIAPSNHGLEYAFAYYLLNRVSSRATPVTMVLGLSTTFQGFLDKGSFSIVETERLLGQFSLPFTAIPQPSLLDLALDQ